MKGFRNHPIVGWKRRQSSHYSCSNAPRLGFRDVAAAWWATRHVSRRNGGEAVEGSSESNRNGGCRRKAYHNIRSIGVAVLHQFDDQTLISINSMFAAARVRPPRRLE